MIETGLEGKGTWLALVEEIRNKKANTRDPTFKDARCLYTQKDIGSGRQ